jgi:HSP20 family protein
MTSDLDVLVGTRPALWDWLDGDVRRFFPRFAWSKTSDDGWIRIEQAMQDDTLVVRAEMPGVDPEHDVDVTVDRGYLTIRAERRDERPDKDDGAFRTEFRYGSFVRTLRLPEGAKTDDITASYANGVLEVRVAMPAPAATPPTQKVTITRG